MTPLLRRGLAPAALLLGAAPAAQAQLMIINASDQLWHLRLGQRPSQVQAWLRTDSSRYLPVRIKVSELGSPSFRALTRFGPGAEAAQIPIRPGRTVLVRTEGIPATRIVEVLDLVDGLGNTGVCSLAILRPNVRHAHLGMDDSWFVKLNIHKDKKQAFHLFGVTAEEPRLLRIHMRNYQEFPGGKPGDQDFTPIQEGSEAATPAAAPERKGPLLLPPLPPMALQLPAAARGLQRAAVTDPHRRAASRPAGPCGLETPPPSTLEPAKPAAHEPARPTTDEPIPPMALGPAVPPQPLGVLEREGDPASPPTLRRLKARRPMTPHPSALGRAAQLSGDGQVPENPPPPVRLPPLARPAKAKPPATPHPNRG